MALFWFVCVVVPGGVIGGCSATVFSQTLGEHNSAGRAIGIVGSLPFLSLGLFMVVLGVTRARAALRGRKM